MLAASLPLSVQEGFAADHLPSPSRDVPGEWLTKAERTDFAETPRYDETVAYCRRLAGASDWVTFQSFGRSGQGRDLPLLIVSKDRAFTPEAARASSKLIVLVQNCIHAGECAGKDASLMLLRDIAITKTRAALLDQVTLLVMPIFNTDGHERFSAYSRINQNGPKEMGWRVTARNLNLNRDYLKADTVEMRAWLSLWNRWRPDFHFDNHTTDGGDWQYDVIFDSDTHDTAAPDIANWLSGTLYPHLFKTLEEDGHVPMVYFNLLDARDPSKGIRSGGMSPRFSTGYVALHNRPSILVEMHALKPYRTRVIGNYNIMLRTLELLNRRPDSLRSALRKADHRSSNLMKDDGGVKAVPLSVTTTDDATTITFKGFAYRTAPSNISGATRIIYDNTQPVDLELTWRKTTRPEVAIKPPLGYLIPPEWTEAIELVKLHGLRGERLTEPYSGEVESYRFHDVSFASRPFEGRTAPEFKLDLVVERRAFPAGSVLVPLDQPGAKVAMHLFEPEAPDSLVRWGFFNAIFEQKEYGEAYVLERLAREMVEADAGLRAEFEEKVRGDADFASSNWARLYFFYRRSPYWDEYLNHYPIARLIQPLSVSTKPLE